MVWCDVNQRFNLTLAVIFPFLARSLARLLARSLACYTLCDFIDHCLLMYVMLLFHFIYIIFFFLRANLILSRACFCSLFVVVFSCSLAIINVSLSVAKLVGFIHCTTNTKCFGLWCVSF